MCITGVNEAEHLEISRTVLQRLDEHRLRIKQSKCKFVAQSVNFLGHRLDAEGIHTMSEKVGDAVMNAPVPRIVQELRSLLGLLNYYRKFLPNIAIQFYNR